MTCDSDEIERLRDDQKLLLAVVKAAKHYRYVRLDWPLLTNAANDAELKLIEAVDDFLNANASDELKKKL